MSPKRLLILWLAVFAFAGLLLTSCGGGGGGGDDNQDDDADDDAQDNTPPDFDGAKGAETVDYHTIRVYWDKATDDHAKADEMIYSIYVAESDGDFDFSSPAFLSTIGRTESLVKLLKPATEYKFVVRATDLAGNQEENTKEVTAPTDELPGIDCGGIGGGAGKGTLYVKVVDQDCDAIEGALVWTNNGDDSGTTNSSGEAELNVGAKDGATVNVSAAKDGYISETFFDVPYEDADHVTFRLEPYPPTNANLYLSCGTMDSSTTSDIPQAEDILDDLTVAGFVVESLTKEKLLEFDLNSLLGPNIPFTIPGIGEIDLPSNIWIPPVSAFGITLQIDPFFVPLTGSTEKPHTIFAYIGSAYLSDILEQIGGDVDIAKVLALVSPQKMGVIRHQTFEEGDPDNPSATFEVPLDYPLVDLSNGPTDDPKKIIYPVEGSIYDLPTNVANPGIINLIGGDLGTDGLIGMSIAAGEYPTLAGVPATGVLDDMEFLAISVATVSDRDSPYLDAFSGVIAIPDFGGGNSGTVTFEKFLNFTLTYENLATRTYSWEDTTNAGIAPELGILNWMDSDRQLVWKGYFPNPAGSRTSVVIPTLPGGIKITDMHTHIQRFQALLAQHVWFDYANFPLEVFSDLVLRVTGKEAGPED